MNTQATFFLVPYPGCGCWSGCLSLFVYAMVARAACEGELHWTTSQWAAAITCVVVTQFLARRSYAATEGALLVQLPHYATQQRQSIQQSSTAPPHDSLPVILGLSPSTNSTNAFAAWEVSIQDRSSWERKLNLAFVACLRQTSCALFSYRSIRGVQLIEGYALAQTLFGDGKERLLGACITLDWKESINMLHISVYPPTWFVPNELAAAQNSLLSQVTMALRNELN